MPILSKQNNPLAGCLFERANGRGGIRTHGGFPHARFRVECLKPDSATLPTLDIVRVISGGAIVVPEFANAKHDTSVSMTRWTDERYIEALAKAVLDHGESAA
jgi:hypothetical protein